MGVKDLWSVLAPVCEKKSLWELENKAIAIDLSAWICDSNSIVTPQINMYLRNLFFRTNYLLLLGVKPIFVLEGDAPEVKAATIRKRMGKKQNAESENEPNAKKVKRIRLKGLQTQCVELLNCMGVKCFKAKGEAEAFCAHLNSADKVVGVVTQDSDAFLYGAKEVYRNFQMGPNYTCDCYRMDVIEQKLGLSRTKLIGFSVLTGSDYNSGVSNVGKQTALKFLASIPDEQIYQKFVNWQNSSYFDELAKQKYLPSGLQLELSIRNKAVQDKEFPYLNVIAEFTSPPDEVDLTWEWHKPNLKSFVAFTTKKLAWDEEYSISKFIPLMGRWHLQNPQVDSLVYITSILGYRKQGVDSHSYKVNWCINGLTSSPVTTTWECEKLVKAAYPAFVETFHESRGKKKRVQKTVTGKKRGKTENISSIKQPNNLLGTCIILEEEAQPDVLLIESDSDDQDNDFNVSHIIENIVSRGCSNPVLLKHNYRTVDYS